MLLCCCCCFAFLLINCELYCFSFAWTCEHFRRQSDVNVRVKCGCFCTLLCECVCMPFCAILYFASVYFVHLNERECQHCYTFGGRKYRCCATNQHSLLIAKLIVMIMIINIIFVSEWHFVAVETVHSSECQAENKKGTQQWKTERHRMVLYDNLL